MRNHVPPTSFEYRAVCEHTAHRKNRGNMEDLDLVGHQFQQLGTPKSLYGNRLIHAFMAV